VNILFFTGSIDWGGGTERAVTMIGNDLSRKNFNVKILSFFEGASSFYDLEPEIDLLSLQMKGKKPSLHYFNIIFRLRRLLLKNNIDVIVITDVILSLYVLPAIQGTNIKTVYRENFNYFTDLSSFKRKIARILTIKYVDVIVTLTTQDQECYESNKTIPKKITTIYNVKSLKAKQRPEKHSNIVISVGKLSKQKGFDLLLQAWHRVCEHNQDWKLWIIGAGVERQHLEIQAEQLGILQSVEFIGQVSNVEEYYQKASIYVMSSRFEGFPNVLLEAKEMGLPVVSFDCKYGPAEVVRDNIDGFLAEPENTDDLSEKLLHLMDDAELRKRFSQNALQDMRFEPDTILPQWEHTLLGLMK
jgi:glycosyltransferase involved in cell wall biosynthesis